MNHRQRRRSFVPILVLLSSAGLGAVLAGCSNVTSTATDPSSAGQVVLAAVDDAFAGAATADGTDLAPASVVAASSVATGTGASATAQSLDPIVVVRRADMRRERRLVSLVFDQQPDPTSAEAQVWVKITGKAELWQTYPVAGSGATLLGSKPIDLEGTITFEMNKGADGWRLTSLSSTGLDQGSYAAKVASVAFAPDPLLIAHADNVGTVGLAAPDTTDAFLVVARGGAMAPHGVLSDDGVAPDGAADDGVYSGFVWVGASTRAGTHLAFVTALDYTRTIDLSQSGGAYLEPYTFTLHPVVVDVAASE